MFKKDNWLLGISIGVAGPLLLFSLLYITFYAFGMPSHENKLLKQENLSLTAVFLNMIVFRYYMINLKYDKTGRGILITTVFYAIFFFFTI